MTKLLLVALLITGPLKAQLDPTRNLPTSPQSTAAPLPEQYLWTANDSTLRRPDHGKFPWNRADLRADPHYFRAHFSVAITPQHATLYLAGPREARVYLNGHLLGDFAQPVDAPINFRVFHADAAPWLKQGDNLLAIFAIRGKGVVTGAAPLPTEELAYGEVLAAKILPAAFGQEATPLLVSTPDRFRSTVTLAPNWQSPAFDDATWPQADTLGPIENIDFYQWSADAGMYGWPGYRGMSSPLRNFVIPVVAVTHVFRPEAFHNLAKLDKPFTVALQPNTTDAESPSLLLDFGKEVAGRLLVESASPQDATLSIAYGESELEAQATGLTSGQQGGNYLGTNLLDVPASGIARGPKSGFRYVRIAFLRGAPTVAFKSIRLEGIYYPVTYAGSFESSDPLLNKIWESGAYTVHLCMQDGIWDAPKRDRGLWVGDLDIEARTILAAFGSSGVPAIEDTLRRLAEQTGPSAHVNGIASYTALWITSLQTLYQYTGDKAFLETQRKALLQLLARMDKDIGPDNLLLPLTRGWGFVDWAPGMYAQTEATRIGTNLQYLRGYTAAVSLLKTLSDTATADLYQRRLDLMLPAARAGYEDSAKRTFGPTWQINTLADLTHLDPDHSDSLWTEVLSHVKQDSPTDQVISPYFGAYLLDAMTNLNHPEAALNWIRTYWGGMIAEGATSLWESYDLRWPKNNYHLSMQADGTSGFFVSLAHGWSSGPTSWISSHILGVTAADPGFNTAFIEPNLLGLTYAQGSVPTPHGLIVVAIKPTITTVDLPQGVKSASVTFHKAHSGDSVFVDGTIRHCTCSGDGSLFPASLEGAGHHTIESRTLSK